MHTLYPAIRPYVSHSLKVEPPHVLHVDECGNPAGIPVVVLHGGPGMGCDDYQCRFFDPDRYHIILFDQRGAGRSKPHAALENNNTQALVNDIEAVREHLGIEQWLVFGGSWGSTLGLVYAETHPQRVLGMVLRGIFLCRPQEIHWFYQEGASRIFPDEWEHYLAPIPEAERDDLLAAYHRRVTGENEVQRMAAAKAWSLWEGCTSTLRRSEVAEQHFADPYRALALARISSHYFIHDTFLEENQILRDAHRLEGIPGVIVHGRYDINCVLDNAWELHKAWPEAELHIIPDAGHSALEPGTLDALVRATDGFAERLG
ncbi:prolyl aminopeptidase [Thiohalomonas denitrificans]|uniref:Proline iminopeptidase n=1 Tax=Thiohalomonas denitrificans TaxID=415747 RepID=A0A1G5QHB4_9GAMM|nr:prolyl aminopeptidase [Thiohalomonas denitrificans]SCZ61082.1 proline iminopeptidase [Thiohalomonas denitrificans]